MRLFALACLSAAAYCSTATTSEPAPKLWYRQPAIHWSEALPIGNGRLAAMIYGGTDSERIQLNEETLYAGRVMDRTNPRALAALPKLRELLLAGQPIEAQKLADRDFLAVPRRQPPYQTLGDLKLTFSSPGSAITEYRRELNLLDGVLRTSFLKDGTFFERTAFASYPDEVIVVHLVSRSHDKLSFSLDLSRERNGIATLDSSFGPNTIVLRGQALPPPTSPEPRAGPTFTAAVRVWSDGQTRSSGSGIELQHATEATLIVAACTEVRSPDPDAICRKQLQAAAERGYQRLLARHVTDFRRLATRVSLQLGDSARQMSDTPTDELLERSKSGQEDCAVTALYFAYGRYLLQSSSRENSLAANLQGKWNDSFDPPWGSKYTININTEMNYWPAEVANLPETVDGLINLMRRMQPNGQRTAREMYGTDGFVAHHNTEVWGDTQPIDGVASGVWPFGAAWLSLTLWERYEYSRDLSFLREKAYPLMRDAAVFVLQNLFDDGAGHLVSGPSLSPENKYVSPDGPVSLDVSPTMDIEITRALFERVRDAARLLHTDHELSGKLNAAEAKLLPLQIGRYGQLQEWRKDYDEVDPGHRHLSHLLAVYPSHEINPNTPELWKAARVSLERRLAHGGGGTGWSRAWVVCLWATFHEGEEADASLRVLYQKSTWPNLFDLHPPHIFQIDGNLGATAGIVEMLLQSRANEIELLPAIPRTWSSGSVMGLRARGGVTLDFAWKHGGVEHATLYSDVGGTWRVRQGSRQQHVIRLRPGQTRTVNFE